MKKLWGSLGAAAVLLGAVSALGLAQPIRAVGAERTKLHFGPVSFSDYRALVCLTNLSRTDRHAAAALIDESGDVMVGRLAALVRPGASACMEWGYIAGVVRAEGTVEGPASDWAAALQLVDRDGNTRQIISPVDVAAGLSSGPRAACSPLVARNAGTQEMRLLLANLTPDASSFVVNVIDDAYSVVSRAGVDIAPRSISTHHVSAPGNARIVVSGRTAFAASLEFFDSDEPFGDAIVQLDICGHEITHG